VAPAAAEAALDRWWSAHADRPVIELDHDYLKLGAPLHQPPGRLCRMPAALQHPAHGHRERLELELTPWSASQTELTLRPRRRLHNAVRYFGAAPGLLDRMAELLTGIATGPAGLRMYSLQSEGKFT
jgi:hypothetical protein